MKYTEMRFGVTIAVVALLAAGCTSGASDPVAQEPTAVETTVEVTETPTVVQDEPTVTPTPTEVPVVVTDDDKIAAAIAAYEANVEPAGTIAWDVVSTIVTGDKVLIELCTWSGDTVYDDLRLTEFLITVDGAELTAESLYNSSKSGECLNTQLMDSALAATREYDTFWSAVLADPTTFDREAAAEILEADQLMAASEAAETWINDNTYWKGVSFDAALPDSSLTKIGWRRYTLDAPAFEVFEIISCRNFSADHGLYTGNDVLVDDFQSDSSRGQHAIDLYQFVRVNQEWRFAGGTGLVWADCLSTDWLDAINIYQPDPEQWQVQ